MKSLHKSFRALTNLLVSILFVLGLAINVASPAFAADPDPDDVGYQSTINNYYNPSDPNSDPCAIVADGPPTATDGSIPGTDADTDTDPTDPTPTGCGCSTRDTPTTLPLYALGLLWLLRRRRPSRA